MLGRVIDLTFATPEFFVVFWLLSVGTFMLCQEIVGCVLRLARLYGRNLRHVIVVGEGEGALAVAQYIRQEAGLGYHVVQVIDARGMAENGRAASDLRA